MNVQINFANGLVGFRQMILPPLPIRVVEFVNLAQISRILALGFEVFVNAVDVLDAQIINVLG